jgi:hypothetical protein
MVAVVGCVEDLNGARRSDGVSSSFVMQDVEELHRNHYDMNYKDKDTVADMKIGMVEADVDFAAGYVLFV